MVGIRDGTRDGAMPEFRDFVQARWGALVRFAFLLTGDRGTAEDVVQTALEKCWRRWGSIASERPEAYVRAAIANTAVSRERWRRRRVVEVPADDAVPVPGHGDGVESRAVQALIWSQVQALPVRMRAVVVLRLYEDLSEAETAAVLGCSTGSVKSQLSRALARLRERPELRDLVGLPHADLRDTDVKEESL